MVSFSLRAKNFELRNTVTAEPFFSLVLSELLTGLVLFSSLRREKKEQADFIISLVPLITSQDGLDSLMEMQEMTNTNLGSFQLFRSSLFSMWAVYNSFYFSLAPTYFC